MLRAPTAALRARPKAAATPTETHLHRRRRHPETVRPAPRASRVSAPSTPSVARASHSPSPTVDLGQARTPVAEKKKAGVTPASKPVKASAGKSATKVSAADGGGQPG